MGTELVRLSSESETHPRDPIPKTGCNDPSRSPHRRRSSRVSLTLNVYFSLKLFVPRYVLGPRSERDVGGWTPTDGVPGRGGRTPGTPAGRRDGPGGGAGRGSRRLCPRKDRRVEVSGEGGRATGRRHCSTGNTHDRPLPRRPSEDAPKNDDSVSRDGPRPLSQRPLTGLPCLGF